MTGTGSYRVPEGPLCLSGPLPRPKPGQLPLRGDLAHIALAGTHLAAHYVVPMRQRIGASNTSLFLAPRDDSEVLLSLKTDDEVEVLDLSGPWVWCCLGPEGPAGYVKADCLAD